MTVFFYLLAMLGLNEESITFVKDSRVDQLIERRIEHNKITAVSGFRINIFFQSGNHSRGGALAAQQVFLEKFPDMDSYVSFEEPFFKVNVGNFRTRLEASAALRSIQAVYPQAHVVRDVLNLMDLLGIVPVIPEEDDEDDDKF